MSQMDQRKVWVHKACLVTPQNAVAHGGPRSFGSYTKDKWWLLTFPDQTWVVASNKQRARRYIDDNEPEHLPTGPLDPDFFAALPRGARLTLYYWCTNKGVMEWRHDRVEYTDQGCRVYGQFPYDNGRWIGIDDYLYEFAGNICRGSGAEPVHVFAPERPDISI